MMETEGTDLSAAIAEALERQQAAGAQPGQAGPPPTPGPGPAAAPPGAPAAAQPLPMGTPAETPAPAPSGPMAAGAAGMAQHPHFELLVADAEPENEGLKRALIVAVVLLVIVVGAVVLLYLGQEGVLSY